MEMDMKMLVFSPPPPSTPFYFPNNGIRSSLPTKTKTKTTKTYIDSSRVFNLFNVML